MNFRDQLNKINELGINPLDIMVANQLEEVLEVEEKEMNEEEFEIACELIKEAYLNSENIAIENITRALIHMLEDYKLNEIDVWELIQIAGSGYY